MSTNFPGALDALTNPAATDGLTGHAAQHSNANDAIEALQAKVGVDGSAVPTSLDYKVAALASGKEDKTSKGVAGGYAGLDGSGKIPSSQLPSYVDDVLEFANLAAFPATGEAAKIYIALDTNKMYRWSGSAYVEIVSSPGTTDSVTEGSTNLYFTYQRVRDTVLTGLSTATNAVIAAGDSVLAALGKLQAQISGKQDTLVSGVNIKTVGGSSILGSGNIAISGGTGISTVVGIRGMNNSTTPNTKYDVIASQVQCRDVSTGQVSGISNPATITNDISAAGPVANGRDQSGAFSNSSWIHLYYIYNGSALATISSASPPSTGPTLPSGYTSWSYICALRINGSGQIVKSRLCGSFVAYESRQVVLASGTASTETSIDISPFVPPNALQAQYEMYNEGIASSSGAIDGTIILRIVPGSNFFASLIRMSGLANSAESINFPAVSIIPNISQTLYYLVSVTAGTPRLSLVIEGYYIPNGDS